MLCAFLFFINHPMVKVKVLWSCCKWAYRFCFNHPMVKVKVRYGNKADIIFKFQPPYGES